MFLFMVHQLHIFNLALRKINLKNCLKTCATPSFLTGAVLPAGLYEEICLLPSPLSDRRGGGLSTLHAEPEHSLG